MNIIIISLLDINFSGLYPFHYLLEEIKKHGVVMHFSFIDNSVDLNTSIQGTYDPGLVLLSIFVACVASYTAFMLSEKISLERSTTKRNRWLFFGAITQGLGIWAMHFIAMLAFSLPIVFHFNLFMTAFSIIPAILASLVLLRTTIDKEKKHLPLTALLVGGGIGLMHYIGMSAMHMAATMSYHPWLFVASIVIAVLLAYLALTVKLWAELHSTNIKLSDPYIILASLIMGISIAAMHFTAMKATYIFPNNDSNIYQMILSPDVMAWLIGGATISIVIILFFTLKISYRIEQLQIIKKDEERFRAIIDNTMEGIISINEKGLIDIFNHGAEKMFGYNAKEVIGKNISILLPLHQQEKHEDYTAHSRLHASRILNKDRDLEGLRKNGSLFPLEVNIAPLMVNEKNGFVGMLRDITIRKEAENTLIRTKEEAELSSNAKTTFISHMSHELRTPLNAVLGFAQLLRINKTDSLTESQNNSVLEIETAGNHLLNLVNDILDLSAIESQHTKLNIVTVELSKLLMECFHLIEPQLKRFEVTLKANNEKCLDYVLKADHLRLRQVLLNLLSNACKYNKPNGSVTVDCKKVANNMLRISITDTGIGIPKDKFTDLFEPFNRLGQEGSNLEGSGIGLVITMRLVELMKGNIGVASEPGEGSTFWIDVPLKELDS